MTHVLFALALVGLIIAGITRSTELAAALALVFFAGCLASITWRGRR